MSIKRDDGEVEQKLCAVVEKGKVRRWKTYGKGESSSVNDQERGGKTWL